ncbi:hypothetical protein [Scandinavium goeteborgense]|uniref:Uncharacterized protein n=1 Tax=Scandinavium goeteborgense TaxID=1851514 RepID=A0A4R6DTT3_SCAGO|nr:hypothetical protein [Scandinavium goeteborgense]TDN48084.1 hypothetical protein EC847_12835 [Scandinavium goeteborgense]
MLDQIENLFYSHSSSLNAKSIPVDVDKTVVDLQFIAEDCTFKQLDVYISQRLLQQNRVTSLDDFTDINRYMRVWKTGNIFIHAFLYPRTRTADVTFFFFKGESFLHLDIENVILRYRKHYVKA